jgi:pyruvate kinase
MLDSMVEHERPTRAEVTDVANAVLDGTDAVMLSNETSIGKYPVAAVRFLDRVLSVTEKKYSEQIANEQMQLDMINSLDKSEDALSIAACLLASRLGARAIIIQAHAISTVLAIARFRPQAPLVAVADSIRVYRGLALVRGVSPLLSNASSTESGLQACLAQAWEWIFSQGLALPGDQAVLVSASSDTCEQVDTLQIVHSSSEGKIG